LDLKIQNEIAETQTPEEILRWVTDSFAPDAVLTMSFQHEGVVIAHMLRTIAPETPVLFIDTGYHFSETLAYCHPWGQSLRDQPRPLLQNQQGRPHAARS